MNIKTALLFNALLLAAGGASAGAIVTDGNVSLGVDDYGNLNGQNGVADVTGQSEVGVRYIDDTGVQYEATSHGCACEGWGVASADSSFTGYANIALGTANLTVDNFTSTATTATSQVSTTGNEVSVTHSFSKALGTDDLFQVTVEIENTSGADINELLYRRTLDWDTSPTPFNEFVTISGTATASNVTGANDNGFCDSNPLVNCSAISFSGDAEAQGPEDHGANFDFNFGLLAAGETFSFDIFYGGAANKTDSLAALSAVGANVYSLGWSGTDVDQDGFNDSTGAITPTYIFAFKGVGEPTPSVPEPGTLAIFGLGIIGFAATRRRTLTK